MAEPDTDILRAQLIAAIASATSSASYRDRSVTYRSLEELLVIYAALGGGSFPRRAYYASTSKGLGSRRRGWTIEGGQ